MSDLALDGFLAGEAVGAEVVLHLEACEVCRARLGELERDRQAFRDELPRLRPASTRSRWQRPVLGAAALLATAASLILSLALPRAAPVPELRPERIKGPARLAFVVVHDGRARAGSSGEPVRSGDTLVFSVSSPAPTYVAVLSRDGAGQASIYYPPGGSTAALIEGGRAEPLSPATLLDSTPGAEHLYGLFCPTAIALEGLRTTLASSGELPAPPGCAVDAVTVEKVR